MGSSNALDGDVSLLAISANLNPCAMRSTGLVSEF